MDAESELKLLQRCRRGDEEAFAAIVKQYWPLVRSIALSSTAGATAGRTDVADDLAQEAFCRVYAHLGTLHDLGRFRVWLWGITRNVCIDWMRKSGRYATMLDSAATPQRAADDPALTAEHVERTQLVRQAVNQLPEKYRMVVHLRYLQGMDYKGISQMLGLSISGVSSRLSEAHELLRGKLRPLL